MSFGDATFSTDGRYRYTLTRRWEERAGAVLFVGLNPSTADATKNDRTISRMCDFAKSWGYGAVLVGNLYGLITTRPKHLADVEDPVGINNDGHLRRMAERADLIVCCWGAHTRVEARAAEVKRLLMEEGGPRLLCFGKTKAGHPKHPLYLPKRTELVSL